ncbi:MAG: BBE domain-containing protein, partial [Chloroflexi bacterium]|nr:BBE domain-containing protein [Chloroflexota bacterium]
LHRYGKSGFTKTISDKLIDTAVDGAANFSSPMSAIIFFRVHGAAGRVAADKTAFGLRGDQWDFNVIGQWADAAESQKHTAWVRELWGRMEPLISGSAYINHIAADDRPEKVRASYGPNYDRLVALKKKYDPTNMLRLNPNIRP